MTTSSKTFLPSVLCVLQSSHRAPGCAVSVWCPPAPHSGLLAALSRTATPLPPVYRGHSHSISAPHHRPSSDTLLPTQKYCSAFFPEHLYKKGKKNPSLLCSEIILQLFLMLRSNRPPLLHFTLLVLERAELVSDSLPFPPNLHNKFLHQNSIMISSLSKKCCSCLLLLVSKDMNITRKQRHGATVFDEITSSLTPLGYMGFEKKMF